MAVFNPYATYQERSISTMTKNELILTLYNEIVKQFRFSKIGLERNDVEATHIALLKVENIITELMGSLNMEYEISKQLLDVYEFIYNQTLHINMTKEINNIDGLIDISCDLRDTWEQAMKLDRIANVGSGGY